MQVSELVSLIVPVYQAENNIDRCVDSIVNNTYDSLEIILIDDCSKDGSKEKLKFLKEKYSQVKCFFNEENKGVSYTRNKGLAEAQGKYIMFVDSDDWVEENFIEEMVSLYEKEEPAMPVCGYVNHDELNNNRVDYFAWEPVEGGKRRWVKDYIYELYKKRLLQMIWNKLFLAEIIKENDICFQEGLHVGEDFRFLLCYLKAANQKEFVICNKKLYHYSRDNKDSLATKFMEIDMEDTLGNFRKMFEIMGYSNEETNLAIEKERGRQMQAIAYAIMHDDRLSSREKKRKIIEYTGSSALHRENKMLYLKEKLYKVIRK